MKKFVQSIITALMMIVLMVGLFGCTKEGPIEKSKFAKRRFVTYCNY